MVFTVQMSNIYEQGHELYDKLNEAHIYLLFGLGIPSLSLILLHKKYNYNLVFLVQICQTLNEQWIN